MYNGFVIDWAPDRMSYGTSAVRGAPQGQRGDPATLEACRRPAQCTDRRVQDRRERDTVQAMDGAGAGGEVPQMPVGRGARTRWLALLWRRAACSAREQSGGRKPFHFGD